jgi:SLT domain-containing protein
VKPAFEIVLKLMLEGFATLLTEALKIIFRQDKNLSTGQNILNAANTLNPMAYLMNLIPGWESFAKPPPKSESTPIAREFGGKVQSGKEYLVGERGREKFVAPSDGKIIPESGSDDRENNLLREIRMLNRHVEQLIIHNRDTAIYTRRNADAISSLSGDLFKF